MGGAGSKASKAVARTYPKPPGAAAKPPAVDPVASTSRPPEPDVPGFDLDRKLHPELQQQEQESLPADIAGFLNRTGGNIAGKEVSTHDLSQRIVQQDKQAGAAGRLRTQVLHELFVEAQKQQSPDIKELADRYGADKEWLEKLLQYCQKPVIVRLPDDGRRIGMWPNADELPVAKAAGAKQEDNIGK